MERHGRPASLIEAASERDRVEHVPDARVDHSFDDEYFRSAGITWPEGSERARNPTPRELRRVLRSLGGYQIEYDATGHSLDVTISNSTDAQDWALIWAFENYAGLASEDKPLPLYFHCGNEPLVLRIMSEIANVCGPFLVVFNFEDPRLVTPDGPAR